MARRPLSLGFEARTSRIQEIFPYLGPSVTLKVHSWSKFNHRAGIAIRVIGAATASIGGSLIGLGSVGTMASAQQTPYYVAGRILVGIGIPGVIVGLIRALKRTQVEEAAAIQKPWSPEN